MVDKIQAMNLPSSLVRRTLALLAVVACPTLLGCGQKGPLELPAAARPAPAASGAR